jgi:demethylmenaquinone methyltransferase/2-methoxy-6-polyprenyl-1,4-benzoquinol methylase
MRRSRTSQEIARRYDRLASVYGVLGTAFLMRRKIRRAAVEQMELEAGASVLEVGCGGGANLTALAEGVGPTGRVVGIDVSPGMLRRAEALRRRHGWANVALMEQDATELDAPGLFDSALFSLSYSVLPERQRTLDAVWKLLNPGGRVVIMDAGLPDGWAGRLLGSATGAIGRATFLGDPFTRPWEDLAELAGDVERRRFWPGAYFLCAATKATGD